MYFESKARPGVLQTSFKECMSCKNAKQLRRIQNTLSDLIFIHLSLQHRKFVWTPDRSTPGQTSFSYSQDFAIILFWNAILTVTCYGLFDANALKVLVQIIM